MVVLGQLGWIFVESGRIYWRIYRGFLGLFPICVGNCRKNRLKRAERSI